MPSTPTPDPRVGQDVDPWLVVEELRKENAKLREQARGVASANVHAALQLVELSEARQRDLEERKREVEEALSIAEHASRQKSEFVANLSHELRTPLNAIVGLATLLLETGLSPTQEQYASTLLEAGRGFLGMLNDVLDFAKIEAGKLEPDPQEIDLWQLAENALHVLGLGAAGRIEVGLLIDPTVPRRARVDELRLRQILTNLIGNAIKFTAQGRVTLEVLRCSEPDMLDFIVRDTGCGIDEDVMQRLFVPFSQGDPSTARRYGGTGLGLAISRRLAQLLGGDITASSRVGVGSEFRARIRIADATEQVVEPEVPRVVCLSGDFNVRRTVNAHCRALGVAVSVALTPDQAEDLVGEIEAGEVWLIDDAADAGEIAARALDAGARVVTLVEPGVATAVGEVLLKPLRPTSVLALASASDRHDEEREVPEDLGLRVLLVDDNRANCMVAGAYLRRLGCDYDVASDGQQALERWRGRRYDAILMDCQMPVMDGFETARQIRAQEDSERRTPILAFSASAQPEDRQRCRDAGMDDCLAKPANLHELGAALARLA